MTASLTSQRAKALYAKAWGRPWPRRTGTVFKDEIGTAIDGDELYDYGQPMLDKFDYVCLENIYQVAEALPCPATFRDIIIIRDEYKLLHQTLETDQGTRAFVITGHPGIGKTTFLLYLLLYRLERRIPTVTQFETDYYVIFDKEGATVMPSSADDPRIEDCWALVDNNAVITRPCSKIMAYAKRVIQASSPNPDRWKEWLKHLEGLRILSDLPSPLEIAAVLQELNYGKSKTLPIVSKWGPSIRTAVRILLNPSHITLLDVYAKDAARKMSESLGTIFEEQLPTSKSSTVVFVRPHREPNDIGADVVVSAGARSFVPTKYLSDMVGLYAAKYSNDQCIQLFEIFSTHSLTRSAAGWAHEKNMHHAMISNCESFEIFKGDISARMVPSTHLIAGITASLTHRKPSESFYWMPSVVNFPGIDSVLGNEDGNIFALQATIAEVHNGPDEGLQRVWNSMPIRTSKQYTWHYVLVGSNRKYVQGLVAHCEKKLKDFRFEGTDVSVHVWGCALEV